MTRKPITLYIKPLIFQIQTQCSSLDLLSQSPVDNLITNDIYPLSFCSYRHDLLKKRFKIPFQLYHLCPMNPFVIAFLSTQNKIPLFFCSSIISSSFAPLANLVLFFFDLPCYSSSWQPGSGHILSYQSSYNWLFFLLLRPDLTAVVLLNVERMALRTDYTVSKASLFLSPFGCKTLWADHLHMWWSLSKLAWNPGNFISLQISRGCWWCLSDD